MSVAFDEIIKICNKVSISTHSDLLKIRENFLKKIEKFEGYVPSIFF